MEGGPHHCPIGQRGRGYGDRREGGGRERRKEGEVRWQKWREERSKSIWLV